MTEDAVAALPTFANTGVLTHHDPGCTCWPHVGERDALDAIAAAALAEYRDGKARHSDAAEAERLRTAGLRLVSILSDAYWESGQAARFSGALLEFERALSSTEAVSKPVEHETDDPRPYGNGKYDPEW